jgi:hypothetical protein
LQLLLPLQLRLRLPLKLFAFFVVIPEGDLRLPLLLPLPLLVLLVVIPEGDLRLSLLLWTLSKSCQPLPARISFSISEIRVAYELPSIH